MTKRDQLIDTAIELFGRDGFRATGIDRIIADSGVAKMTLYNHFRSKDELILAALRRRDETFRNWFVRAVERRGATPRERLLAIFEVLREWFARPDFGGCMFINAAAEHCSRAAALRDSIREHKALVRAFVRDLARDAGARDPDALADGICLLIEGAIVEAQINDDPGAADRAGRAARSLIETAPGAG